MRAGNMELIGCGAAILGVVSWSAISGSAPIARLLGTSRISTGILIPFGFVVLVVVLWGIQAAFERRELQRVLEIINSKTCRSCGQAYESITKMGVYGGGQAPGGYLVTCPNCGARSRIENGDLGKR